MAKFKLPEELTALLLIGFMILIGIFIPITLSLSQQEITNPEISFQIFLMSTLLISGAVVVLMLYFFRKKWNKDNKYGNSFGFFNIKESFLPFIRKLSGWQLTLGSFVIFGTLFLIANLSKNLGKGFTGLSVLPQQFSPAQSLAFSTMLIPAAEEMFSLALTGLLVLALILLSVRFNLKKSDFTLIYFLLIPLTIGGLAILWHSTAYASSVIALSTVFFFWVIKTLLILITGFFIVGWILHLLNNFFIDFSRLYTSDVLLGVVISVIVFSAILFYLSLRKPIQRVK